MRAVKKKIGFVPESTNTVQVQVSIDGLPLFKNSKIQFWPILGRVVQPVASDVFIIGLFRVIRNLAM